MTTPTEMRALATSLEEIAPHVETDYGPGQVATYGLAWEALRSAADEIEEQHTRGLELAKILATCITAMNPQDRGGISMHEWNQRLKAATKQACAVFDGSDSAPGAPHD